MSDSCKHYGLLDTHKPYTPCARVHFMHALSRGREEIFPLFFRGHSWSRVEDRDHPFRPPNGWVLNSFLVNANEVLATNQAEENR